ncbi:hypothetical protein [Streptomyces sp. NPDC006971]
MPMPEADAAAFPRTLARRRVDVLFAMFRDGTFYESRPAASA